MQAAHADPARAQALAVSAFVSASQRKRGKSTALSAVAGTNIAGRRSSRAWTAEPDEKLQEKVWKLLRDAKDTPGMRGWLFRCARPRGRVRMYVRLHAPAARLPRLVGTHGTGVARTL